MGHWRCHHQNQHGGMRNRAGTVDVDGTVLTRRRSRSEEGALEIQGEGKLAEDSRPESSKRGGVRGQKRDRRGVWVTGMRTGARHLGIS